MKFAGEILVCAIHFNTAWTPEGRIRIGTRLNRPGCWTGRTRVQLYLGNPAACRLHRPLKKLLQDLEDLPSNSACEAINLDDVLHRA
jgi:hypothetical protein